MPCKICNQDHPLDSDNLCQECADRMGHYDNKIFDLEAAGHTKDCARRMVYGDGQCQCGGGSGHID